MSRARKKSQHLEPDVSVQVSFREVFAASRDEADSAAGVLLVLCLAATGGVLYGFIQGIVEGIHALVWPMFVLVWPVVAVTIGVIATEFGEKDPEKKVEAELQECMKKHTES